MIQLNIVVVDRSGEHWLCFCCDAHRGGVGNGGDSTVAERACNPCFDYKIVVTAILYWFTISLWLVSVATYRDRQENALVFGTDVIHYILLAGCIVFIEQYCTALYEGGPFFFFLRVD